MEHSDELTEDVDAGEMRVGREGDDALQRIRNRCMMSDLLSARSQMGMSLCFHIIFAVIGVSLPLMMTIAELQWLRTREPVYRILAKRWAKGAAILFAIGAVSGTVLSFELGLLCRDSWRRPGLLWGCRSHWRASRSLRRLSF